MVFGGVWSHGVPDVLINIRPLVEGLHHSALKQILVPESLLSQHPSQNFLRTCRDLNSNFPQPQWKPIMHLQKQKEEPNYILNHSLWTIIITNKRLLCDYLEDYRKDELLSFLQDMYQHNLRCKTSKWKLSHNFETQMSPAVFQNLPPPFSQVCCFISPPDDNEHTCSALWGDNYPRIHVCALNRKCQPGIMVRLCLCVSVSSWCHSGTVSRADGMGMRSQGPGHFHTDAFLFRKP